MHADADELPQCERNARVATIRLRQPSKRNALDATALAALEHAITEAREAVDRRNIDCVVLRGEGDHFCAGFDLASCADDPRRVEELLTRLSTCVRGLREIDAPVIARIQGAALAGGCALVTGCDFVVAAHDAQLGYPVHRIGISPAVSIPSLVSRMGPAARALLVSNEIIDGATALARGLATHAVQREALDASVDALVAQLLAKGPEAMRATKRLIRQIETAGSGAIGPARGIDDRAFAETRDASVALGHGEEFATMLRVFWAAKTAEKPR
ncbi:MAG: enoyl-CoA hydratase/isomerase family protein [bacterium]